MNKLFQFLKNLNPTIRNFLIISPFVILVFVGYGFYHYTPKSDLTNLKCPHEYSNSDERLSTFKTFVDSYYDKNPNASISELMDARKQFWIDNNCQEELKGYDDYLTGNVDQNKKEVVENLVDQYLFNSSRYIAEELGFSFQYPNSLFVSVDPESPNRLMILPQSLKPNKDEPITAIIISVSTDDFVYMTAEEWLNSPNSGYDAFRDGNYNHILVGGQDAVMVNDNWVVVKTPDGKERISIALLVRSGAKPLLNELQEILDTFSFK